MNRAIHCPTEVKLERNLSGRRAPRDIEVSLGASVDSYAVGKDTLLLLADRLRPFIERSFERTYPDRWRRLLGLEGQGAQLGSRSPRSLADPDNLLGFMTNRGDWENVFAPTFGFDTDRASEVRGLAYDIRRLRARYALHKGDDFGHREAWRLVDSAWRLLELLGLADDDVANEMATLAGRVPPGAEEQERADAQARREYLASVAARYEYLDLGGIAPAVGSNILQIRLDDVFLPPQFVETSAGSPPRQAKSEVDALLAEIRAEKAERLASGALFAHKRVLLVGGPGSGKTTFLRWIAESLATGIDPGIGVADLTPITIAAPHAADAIQARGISMAEYIGQGLTDRFGSLLISDLRADRVVVLIDGVDEVPDSRRRFLLAQSIEQFAAEYPVVPVICTTREVGLRDVRLGTAFVSFTLLPLTDEEIDGFLRGWFRTAFRTANAELQAHVLAEAIGTNPAIRELAGTPLLLTIIALIALRGGSLPSRRIELFAIATQTLLRQWPLQHGFDIDEFELRSVLGKIATQMELRGDRLVTKSELRRQIESAVVELRGVDEAATKSAGQALLEMAEEQVGFIVQKGIEGGEPVYGFIHKSFAEYLAALELFELYSAGRISVGQFALDADLREATSMFFEHVSETSLELSTRVFLELLAVEPIFERHLGRRLEMALDLLGRGIHVRPAAREAALAAGVEAVLTIESPYVWSSLAAGLAQASLASPAGTAGPPLIQRVSAGSGVRRALISFLLNSSEPRHAVRDFLDNVQSRIAAGDSDALDALHRAISRLGVSLNHESPWVLFAGVPDQEHLEIEVLPSAAVELSAAGIDTTTASDLVVHSGLPAGFSTSLFLVDMSDVPLLEVDDLLRLAAVSELSAIAPVIAERRSWGTEDASQALQAIRAAGLDGAVAYVAVLIAVRGFEAGGGDLPAWVQTTVGTSADVRWRIFISNLAGALLRSGRTWPVSIIASLLRGDVGESDIAIESAETDVAHDAVAAGQWLAARQILKAQLDSFAETGEPWQVPAELRAGLASASTSTNHETMVEAMRAAAVSLWSQDLSTQAFFGSLFSASEEPLDPQRLATLIRLLGDLATPNADAEQGRVITGAVRRLLSWPKVPPARYEDVWEIATPFATAAGGVPRKLPAVLMQELWAIVGDVRTETRAWAAALWATGARDMSAHNEIAILCGDAEGAVRIAGLLAVQPVDLVGGAAWVAEAAERPLRDDNDEQWEAIAGLLSDEYPDFVPALIDVLDRLLDSGQASEGAMELAMGVSATSTRSGSLAANLG